MGIVYTFTHQFDLSLFVTLIILFVRTIYRYNASEEDLKPENYNNLKNTSLFILGLGFIYASIHFRKNLKQYIPITNFILLSYIIISIMEFTVHKYVMHCKNNSYLNYIISKIPYLDNTCKYHATHHINVNTDMSVSDKKEDPLNDSKFRMGWNIYPLLVVTFGISIIFAKNVSGYKISFMNIGILSGSIVFLWEYLWNKTHVAMHNFDYDYSIKKGPYDEGVLNTEMIKNLLYKNHAAHHAQKGDKKGHYNVIFLGADEWFNSNSMIIDNTEYCKTHMEEKACKVSGGTAMA